MLAILGWLFALLLGACLVVAAWPQGFGLEQAPVVAQVVSMRVGVIGLALAAAFVALLLAGWKRIRPLALGVVSMLLVFSLASFGIHASRGFDDGQTIDDSEDLVVLAWNTRGGEPGASEIARIIDETGADVVMLPETTEQLGATIAASLGAEGRNFSVLSTNYSPDYGALNTTLLVAAELGGYSRDLEVGGTRTLPTVVARPDGGDGPVLVSTHPVAPILGQMRNWRADLQFVAGLCGTGDSVIVAGDFNSTLDHWAGLGVDGGDIGTCDDSARAVGAGAVGSWPTWAPPWLGAQISHVVATPDWQPIAARVLTGVDDRGSDHRPVIAQLRQASG